MKYTEKNQEINEMDPLGVLLNLLEKEKLEISNFSLAQVADQYLDYLSSSRDQDKILENISEFLWVASKLALLKSKILLSTIELEEIELEENDDLRDRLIEYQKFKEISKELGFRLEEGGQCFAGKSRGLAIENFSVKFNQRDLRDIFEKVIREFNLENEDLYQKKEVKEVVKIKERIEEIRNILKRTKNLKFSRIISKKTSRLELVISFLSILELVKQGVIEIRQKKSFQDMNIIRK